MLLKEDAAFFKKEEKNRTKKGNLMLLGMRPL